MPSWPTTSLPMSPLIGSLEITSEPNVSQFNPGVFSNVIRSRRYEAKAFQYSATLLLQSNAEKQALDDFFTNDCADGALPFDMTDWVDGEVQNFQWIAEPIYSHISKPGIWHVRLQLLKMPQPVTETVWTPAELFVGGRQGLWFDFSDLSTLFTAVGGTGAVTADNDPVGNIQDKSGNGNVATRIVDDSRRALYKTSGGRRWLQFNASNQAYDLLSSLGLTNAISHLTVFAGVLPTDNAAEKTLLNFSNGSGAGSARASFRLNASEALRMGGRRLDGDGFSATDGSTSLSLVTPSVITGQFKWASSDLVGRLNGVQEINNTTWQTDGSTSATNSVGAGFGYNTGATEFFGSRCYQLIAVVTTSALTAEEIALAEQFIADKIGITI